QHIALTALAQRVAKPRVAAQFIITGDPAVRHLFPPRVEHLQALLLPCVIPHLWPDVACLASLRIAGPLFGQRQTEVEQGMVLLRDIAHEDTELGSCRPYLGDRTIAA